MDVSLQALWTSWAEV
uniref:Uncharacterized protein n=1 Tax=Anguilla anguilla TaxID=7936 RepID=A0A0E9WDX8_ANGAN